MKLSFVILLIFNASLALGQANFYYVDKSGIYSLEKLESYFETIHNDTQSSFLFISNNKEPIICQNKINECITKVGDIKPNSPSFDLEIDTLIVLLNNFTNQNKYLTYHFFVDFKDMINNQIDLKFIQRLLLVLGDESPLQNMLSKVVIHIDINSLSNFEVTKLKNNDYIYGNSFKISLY
jgi:hypothetical protein